MKILHIVAPAWVGGLERVVHGLAIGQQRSGEHVAVAAVLDAGHGDHPFLAPLRQANVETIPLLLPPRRYRRERARIHELCRALRPDVVHTHGYRADVVDSGVARALGIPTVTTVHGFTGGGWKNHLYEGLQRAAFRHFDAVVAVCRPLAEKLAHDGLAPGRIHLLPNAWVGGPTPLEPAAARRALALSDDVGMRIGWVGRLSREKGPDMILEAASLLADVPFTLSMLGDGPWRTGLEARAAALGLGRSIRWHGAVPEAARLFSAFDAFVLSSRREGTPIALFEAMAAGVPIIATNVGGVPDVLSRREAVVIPPEDPAALAAAILQLHHDPAAAADRARAARARLESEFRLAPWVRRYEALYSAVRDGTSHTRDS